MTSVAWPSMRQTFGLPLDAVGLLFIAEMVGLLVASSCGGPLVARIGVGRLLLLSLAVRGLTLLGYGLAPAWWLVVLLGVAAGAGGGAVGAAANTYFATNHSPALMNWLHACYGVGAALGPSVMRLILDAGHPWRWGYVVAALAAGLLALCLALTLDRWRLATEPSTRPSAKPSPSSPDRARSVDTLKLPLAWAGIALIFLFAGTEATAGQWSYSLFTTARSIAPNTAGFWTSLYWGGSTAGRILFGFVAARWEVRRLLRVVLLGAVCGTALVWANGIDLFNFFGLVLLGFALAPIFPLITSGTPQRVGAAHAANAIGFQVASAGLGVSLWPALAGVLAERVGLEVIGPFLLVTAVALFCLHELIARRE
jgi:fucose permease